jgi:hypothetical protein
MNKLTRCQLCQPRALNVATTASHVKTYQHIIEVTYIDYIKISTQKCYFP